MHYTYNSHPYASSSSSFIRLLAHSFYYPTSSSHFSYHIIHTHTRADSFLPFLLLYQCDVVITTYFWKLPFLFVRSYHRCTPIYRWVFVCLCTQLSIVALKQMIPHISAWLFFWSPPLSPLPPSNTSTILIHLPLLSEFSWLASTANDYFECANVYIWMLYLYSHIKCMHDDGIKYIPYGKTMLPPRFVRWRGMIAGHHVCRCCWWWPIQFTHIYYTHGVVCYNWWARAFDFGLA